ncbi:MAG: septum formation protein Maf [Gammaproteobacteria bacterium]|nr:septum formation protein Maf [Gammaproteobacteria bacterium]MBT8052721.1 septum formation protein Maf [Gammaproteobacteria bacterium]
MQQSSYKRKLILASSSPYRKLMLERLAIPFDVRTPEVDETPASDETAHTLVARLAAEKAAVVAESLPDAVVIGSDQVAVAGRRIVGKPGSVANARRQLSDFSGRDVQFLSAICVLCRDTGFEYRQTVVTDVCFRPLNADEIDRYIQVDQPLNCAGSFKSESLGISLLSAMRSDDPTAIIGLPLIYVSEALRKAGYNIP